MTIFINFTTLTCSKDPLKLCKSFIIQINIMRKTSIPIYCTFGFLFLLSVLFPVLSAGQPAKINGKYNNHEQIVSLMKELQVKNQGIIKIHNLASTPGKRDVLLYEIGSEINSQTKINPAVLVVANMEGINPLGSEAALTLAQNISGDAGKYKNLTWYILPSGNPDGAEHFFDKPLYKDPRNDLAVNDDLDEQTDEDGYNDLDGNGIITIMRVKSPEGEWIPVATDPRLMKKADPSKGEKGIYKLYSEGLDDDGDGKYNEDLPGGTNVGLNFPHLFKFFVPANGLYPGSSAESFELMKFIFSHPEIAMTFSFGSSNFCTTPPKGGRAGSVDMEKITIPEDVAKAFGADASKTYSMKEIMEMVKPMVPAGMEIDENMVASFLGLGAVVNPMNEDLAFYKKLSEDYADFLKNSGFTGERFDPEDGKDGSFELWSYYHLGVPVFSMDLWSIPKPKEEKSASSDLTPDAIEKMSKDEFLAIGEEKFSAIMKASGAPPQFKAAMVFEGVKSGQMTPKQIGGMMKQIPKPSKDADTGDPKEKAILAFYDKNPGNSVFINWTKYNHPDLGELEIGGFIPFCDNTPPIALADSLIKIQIPWIFKLTEQLPLLKISDTKITPKGGGIYQLEAWISNDRYLPYPTAMGKKNKQPAPVVCALDGKEINILSGRKRMVITGVPGMKKVKIEWLVQAEKGADLTLKLTSKSAGNDSKQLKIAE